MGEASEATGAAEEQALVSLPGKCCQISEDSPVLQLFSAKPRYGAACPLWALAARAYLVP